MKARPVLLRSSFAGGCSHRDKIVDDRFHDLLVVIAGEVIRRVSRLEDQAIQGRRADWDNLVVADGGRRRRLRPGPSRRRRGRFGAQPIVPGSAGPEGEVDGLGGMPFRIDGLTCLVGGLDFGLETGRRRSPGVWRPSRCACGSCQKTLRRHSMRQRELRLRRRRRAGKRGEASERDEPWSFHLPFVRCSSCLSPSGFG